MIEPYQICIEIAIGHVNNYYQNNQIIESEFFS